MPRVFLVCILFVSILKDLGAQQRLNLKEAVQIAATNYGIIRAKQDYAEASEKLVSQSRYDYLPNFNIAAQQDYGTINGQNGPLYGFGGLAAASSGLPLPQQNWNAAFGALYLTNINWDFFAFGRAKERIATAKAAAERDRLDLRQELFQHKIRVAAAYLNLIAARQLLNSYKKNLDRADTFRRIVVTRALNGLVAGVDSSLANAEFSNAKITLTKAIDAEQEQSNRLAQLLGIAPQEFYLDSLFISRLPVVLADTASVNIHPLLRWFESRIAYSNAQTKYFKTFYYPSFSLVGILQTRGSGFGAGYAANQGDFNRNYWKGVSPSRTNYLVGLGVTWNITQPLRISQQVQAQKLISSGLKHEYDLAAQQMRAQLQLAETRIKNAISNYREAPVQVKAASDAFIQRSTLYKNGLTNLVDVTQALYALIRAETDRDIANNNVWQALLLKAAAAGDFAVFEEQL